MCRCKTFLREDKPISVVIAMFLLFTYKMSKDNVFSIVTVGKCSQVLFKVTSILIRAKLPTKDICMIKKIKDYHSILCIYIYRPRPWLALVLQYFTGSMSQHKLNHHLMTRQKSIRLSSKRNLTTSPFHQLFLSLSTPWLLTARATPGRR